MATDLKIQIDRGEPYGDPANPVEPWNVKIEWCRTIQQEVPIYDGEEETEEHITGYKMEDVQEIIRTWMVETPSELVARTIELAIQNVTDGDYEVLRASYAP